MRGVIALRTLVLAVGAALGIFYPFLSVILADRGFSPGEIGLIASIGAVGFTIAVPAWGHVADVKLGRPRTLQLCALMAAAVVAALLLPLPMVVVALLVALFPTFQSSWQPLADAITINTVRGREYARVRLLTSLSFALAAIVGGFIYDRIGYSAAFVLMPIAALVIVIAAFGVPDVGRADLASHRSRLPAWSSDGVGAATVVGRAARWSARLGSSGVALRVAPRLRLVLAAVTLLHIGVISGFTFLGLRIVELGGAPSDVALSAAVSAASEIPAMLLAARVARRIGLRGMFVGSALLYALCFALWTVVDSPTAIVLTRAITGIAFAGVVVGVVLTIAALLPADLQATGQALYQTTAFGIAAIVANILGGVLYGSVGHAALFGVGALLALGAAGLGWFAFPRAAPAGAPVAVPPAPSAAA
jgi:PPP family 3-phenylpropionic acid transporter